MLTEQDIKDIKQFLSTLMENYNLSPYDREMLQNVIFGLDFVGNVLEKYIDLITILAAFKGISDNAQQELMRNGKL